MNAAEILAGFVQNSDKARLALGEVRAKIDGLAAPLKALRGTKLSAAQKKSMEALAAGAKELAELVPAGGASE